MARKLAIGCAVAAAIGLLPFPYSYYVLLRLVFFVSLAVLGFTIYDKSREITPTLVIICLLAVLYNPLILVSLGSKLAWIGVNAATLCFIFWAVQRSSSADRKLN
jgi:hypothetical protein